MKTVSSTVAQSELLSLGVAVHALKLNQGYVANSSLVGNILRETIADNGQGFLLC